MTKTKAFLGSMFTVQAGGVSCDMATLTSDKRDHGDRIEKRERRKKAWGCRGLSPGPRACGACALPLGYIPAPAAHALPGGHLSPGWSRAPGATVRGKTGGGWTKLGVNLRQLLAVRERSGFAHIQTWVCFRFLTESRKFRPGRGKKRKKKL